MRVKPHAACYASINLDRYAAVGAEAIATIALKNRHGDHGSSAACSPTRSKAGQSCRGPDREGMLGRAGRPTRAPVWFSNGVLLRRDRRCLSCWRGGIVFKASAAPHHTRAAEDDYLGRA